MDDIWVLFFSLFVWNELDSILCLKFDSFFVQIIIHFSCCSSIDCHCVYVLSSIILMFVVAVQSLCLILFNIVPNKKIAWVAIRRIVDFHAIVTLNSCFFWFSSSSSFLFISFRFIILYEGWVFICIQSCLRLSFIEFVMFHRIFLFLFFFH